MEWNLEKNRGKNWEMGGRKGGGTATRHQGEAAGVTRYLLSEGANL